MEKITCRICGKNVQKLEQKIENFLLTNLQDHNSGNQQPSFCSKKNPRTEEGSETNSNKATCLDAPSSLDEESKDEDIVRTTVKAAE